MYVIPKKHRIVMKTILCSMNTLAQQTRDAARHLGAGVVIGGAGAYAAYKWSNGQRGWTWAGAVGSSTKNKMVVSHTILEEVKDTYAPQFTNLTILNDQDIRLIKETFGIANRSGDFKIMKTLRDKVERILQTKSEAYDIEYLNTVVKDYNYFSQQV